MSDEQAGPGDPQHRTYAKPLPEPNPVSKPFWDAAKEHRLLLQRSRRTGKWVFYPRAVSPFGAGDALDWTRASGRGTVASFTVARRPTAPQWAGDGDYVIAIIELEEGVHMTGNVVECDPDTVRVGMPVEAVFTDVTPEITLVQWRPAPSVAFTG
jgi:uncharacterized OB-fold protein